ncbi:hypothetical protein INS49_010941 [Diaporthe citri]|uniref:uncharacterized protein n=1 Tax=Diaporthe citri TaxID=83186 RepID=UPI001C80FF3D|nr:uncharacterized protein INS49_010941 [Diaporthe citri]KAG6359888.1 hypothetical protein INS49_010941 [Diaporthe citri]
MERPPLRAVGNLEKFLIHQHLVQFFNNVQVACVYSLPARVLINPRKRLPGLVYAALGKTIECHPILGLALKNEDSPEPAWRRLERVDLRQIVEFIDADPYAPLDTWIQEQHQKPVHKPQELPLWRCVSVHSSQDAEDAVSFALSFSFHHVVGDGLSGAAFHRTFRHALNELLSLITNTPDDVDFAGKEMAQIPKLALVPHLEESMDLPLTTFFLLNKAFKSFVYNFTDTREWTGPLISNTRAPISNTRTFYLPQEVLRGLRDRCRTRQTTITALVTVLTARSLALLYPTHTRFVASVPFSLRKFSKHSPDDMGCLTAIAEPHFSSEPNQPWGYMSCRFGSTPDAPSASDDEKLWKEAKACKDLIHRRSGSSTNLSVGLTKFVGDYRQHFLNMVGGRRRHAFTVTNIGVVDGGGSLSPATEKGQAIFDRVVFSVGASTNGAPYSICLASATDGFTSVTLNWETGVVEDRDAHDLLGALEREMSRLAEFKVQGR